MWQLLTSDPVWTILGAGVLGLLVGSFLNVVILRLPERLMHGWREQGREVLGLEPVPASTDPAPPDLVVKASHCPHCKHALSPLDNIPLLSFLVLRGKCRYCGAKISWQYPIVEALTGLVSAACLWKFGPSWPGLGALVLSWILIAAAGIDLRTQLLPDQLTLPLLWIGLLASTQAWYVDTSTAILGAAAGYLVLWSVYWAFKLLTGKEGMGYGDFKLLGALGAFVGYQGIVPILLFSSLIGAIVGSIWLATQGRDKATPIPFGPYLAAAGWVQFMFGGQLVDLWLRQSGM